VDERVEGRGEIETEKELIIESPPTSELKDEEEEFYSDGLGDDETRSTSPSKLTARQRAKGNKDLQETLVSLPGAFSLTHLDLASDLGWSCGVGSGYDGLRSGSSRTGIGRITGGQWRCTMDGIP
jgi:hypothetical protein